MCLSSFKQKVVVEPEAQTLYSYNSSNRWESKDFETEKTSDVILKIKDYLKKDKKVLDIGCNTGELLDYCKKYGAKTFGIEYSKKSKDVCIKKGHKIYKDIDDIKEDVFDLIFAFDLVEHLYDVGKFFKKVNTLLRSDGKLIILTGNPNCLSAKLAGKRWWYSLFPEHVVFPSKEFFNNFCLINLEKYIPVFNSKFFAQQYLFSVDSLIYKKIMNLAGQILRGAYTGLPSINRDHALIILSKKNEKNSK